MIKPLAKEDYRAVFDLSKRLEPYPEHNYFDQFSGGLDARRGFTIWNEAGNLTAFLSYSNFIPGSEVMIHFMNEPGGLTREVIRKAFGFPFNELHVPRLVSYCVKGVTDKAGDFLERLGFRIEGVRKEAARLPDGPQDVKMFRMLKRECKWL